MLFNSPIFIFAFLPIAFFIYFYLNSKKLTEASKAFLVFASLFFYSWWNIAYLPIILVSMLFNYIIGISLSKNQEHTKISKKTLLAFGVTANIALLGYFKYVDFFIENVNLAADTDIPLLHLALPLAISFFTFQQIAYLVDSYRGETKEYDFLNYANFVTFFPQLIAGPIVHHAEMMPQFAKMGNKVKDYKNIAMGLFIFSIGLFKKVVIADSFAVWAAMGFDTADSLSFFEAWATSLSYTFQLYFDFSGYTDMAIGAALLFNIRLPINFNSPYKALDIQDFWKRWHITLSRFLKEYVYIPLGGNRKGSFHTYTNLLLTFLIGGIWHGAGWTFVFWGFLHGVAMVIHRFWKMLGMSMPGIFAWFLTFAFINTAWVFFRAREWDDAIRVLNGMADLSSIHLSAGFLKILQEIDAVSFASFSDSTHASSLGLETLVYLIVFAFVAFFMPNSMQIAKKYFQLNLAYAFLFALLFFASTLVSFFGNTTASEFIYFNF